MSRPTSPPPSLPNFLTSASDNHPFTSPARTSTLPQHPTQPHEQYHKYPPHRTHRLHHTATKSVPQSAIDPPTRSSAHPLGFGNPQSDVGRPHHRASGAHHHHYHSRHHTHGGGGGGGGIRDDEEARLLRSVFESGSGSSSSNPNRITGMDSLSDADRSRRRRLIEQANATAAAAAADADARQRREKEKENTRKRELRGMRAKREGGDGVLRAQLAQLSDVGTATTRRLDYTYFSLLTSLSHLSAGVRQLHGLAVKEGGLKEGFGRSVAEVEAEVGRGVGKVGEALSGQAGRAEGLQERMVRGREKVVGLGERLDRVRGRVEEAERRDGEGRKRVGRRWTICWVCSGFWIGVLVVLLVVKKWRYGGFGVENEDATRLDLPMEERGRGRPDEVKDILEKLPISEMVSSALAGVTAVSNESWTVKTAAAKEGSHIDAEATLRHLDEL